MPVLEPEVAKRMHVLPMCVRTTNVCMYYVSTYKQDIGL